MSSPNSRNDSPNSQNEYGESLTICVQTKTPLPISFGSILYSQLITKSALPGSTFLSYDEQKARVGNVSKNAQAIYHVAKTREVLVAIFTHNALHSSLSNRLYGSPSIVRCQERAHLKQGQVAVGRYTTRGIVIDSMPDEATNTSEVECGVCAVRRL
jgi:hypothetical protein